MTLPGDTEDEDSASTSSSLKRGVKDLKKRKMEESNSIINSSKQESFTSVKKPKRDDSKDLALCRYYYFSSQRTIDLQPPILFA